MQCHAQVWLHSLLNTSVRSMQILLPLTSPPPPPRRPAMLTPRILGAVPIVPVSSIKDSLTWYEKLGFVPRTDEDGDADNYALLTLGAVELHLRQVNSSEKLDAEANANGVYVRVEGLDALHDEFKGKGLSSLKGVQDTQWGMREFALSDPDGTLLRFGQIKTSS